MLYLGPLGNLVEINPRTGVETTSQRFGGTHTALSGRRTVDHTGNRATFAMRWKHLTEDQLVFFEALHHRHIRGPLRLVLNGLKRNRLSRSAASAGYGRRRPAGIEATNGNTDPDAAWPTEATPHGEGLRWSGWAVGDGVLRFDRDTPPPIVPGDTITASVYVRAATADTVRLVLDHYGSTGYSGSTAGADVVLTADTWERITVTTTPASDVWAVSPAIQPVATATGSAFELFVAAAQMEAASAASGWTLGGGAPLVAVDQLPTEALYAPYTRPEMTLLEL